MVTIKTHKGCGGKIIDRKCQKCGKVWKRLSLGLDISEKAVSFDEKAYRRRIREMKDLDPQ